MMKLPEKQAKRIYARYYLGMTVNEIAEVEKPCPRQYPPWIKAACKIFLIKFHLMRLFFAFLSVLIRGTSFPPSSVHMAQL